MSLDEKIFKIHPLIGELRQEFMVDQISDTSHENFWFCLRPDKKIQYMEKNKLYQDKNIDSPRENKELIREEVLIMQGFARKTGESLKNSKKIEQNIKPHAIKKNIPKKTNNILMIVKSENKSKTSIVLRKKPEILNFKNKLFHINTKNFLIQIDD